MVDFKTGELDVRRKFSEWRGAPKDYLWHVVAYIRRVFYKIETCNPCNPEAARLFESDPDMFKVHLQECLRKADTELYNHEESCIEYVRPHVHPTSFMIDHAPHDGFCLALPPFSHA